MSELRGGAEAHGEDWIEWPAELRRVKEQQAEIRHKRGLDIVDTQETLGGADRDLEDMRPFIHSLQHRLGSEGGVSVLAKYINALTHRDSGRPNDFHLEVVKTETPKYPTPKDRII